jgi:hypothetical protein
MQNPIALSDSQLTTIMGLARPLQPHERARFLELVASRLNGRSEIGDGQLYRLLRDLQRECFRVPDFGRDNGGNKSRAYRGISRRLDDDDVDDRPRRRRDRGTA